MEKSTKNFNMETTIKDILEKVLVGKSITMKFIYAETEDNGIMIGDKVETLKIEKLIEFWDNGYTYITLLMENGKKCYIQTEDTILYTNN